MQLPAGWTEITGDRHREFKAAWRSADGDEHTVEVGSLVPDDAACLAEIEKAAASIAAEDGEIVT